MTAVDFAIVGAFLAYSIGSGLRNRAVASQNLDEYFLAGRSESGWRAGISMAATQFAADTPLLVTGIIAVSGIFALWQMWIYALAFLLMGFVLAPSWRRTGVLTDAELAELRYGGNAASFLRAFKALFFGTLFNCTVLAWVFFAAAKVSEPFLLWDEWLPPGLFGPLASAMEHLGVPIALHPEASAEVWAKSANNLISLLLIVAVTTAYSTTGGLRSVIATDVVQFALMMVSTIAFAWIVTDRAGGLTAIHTAIQSRYPDADAARITAAQILAFTPDRARDTSFTLLALFGLQWLIQLNADGTGYLAQRSMACRTDRDARIAALVFTGAQVLFRSLVWIPLGLGLLVLFPPDAGLTANALQADREGSYVRGIAELLPAGLKGLMLTAMLAAFASTVDTHLNWGASYWTNDIVRRFFFGTLLGRQPRPRTLIWVARASNLLLVVIALGVMTQLSSIHQAWQTSLLLGAGMGTVLLLRWLWWRINAWAEIAAIAASAILAPLLLAYVDDPALRLLLIALGSTAAALAAVRIAGPEPNARLCEFYRRVRPPGFWRPVALMCGEVAPDGPHRLLRGLGATAAAALCLFCLLTAVGSWLAGSPPPGFVPDRALWIGALFVIAAALTPVWIRLGFADSDSP